MQILNPQIQLFFDVVSPYTYFCFLILKRYETSWNFTLKLIPCYLGGIMQATQNRPPASLPARAMYLAKDLQRTADILGITVKPPKPFPFETLQLMRVLCVISVEDPLKLEEALLLLWREGWGKGGVISVESLKPLLNSNFNEIVEKSRTEKYKKMLQVNTDRAVELGAYGLPFMVVQTTAGKSECFFGSDRFEHIAHFLKVDYSGMHGPKQRQKL